MTVPAKVSSDCGAVSVLRRGALLALCGALIAGGLSTRAEAQSVCLPAPRLLTTKPMGGQAGTQFEVLITGEELDDANQLTFSDPRITATRKLNAAGVPEPGKYLVTIAADCPAGVHEARIMTRLGMSSTRAFTVGTLPEVQQGSPNTTLATAMPLAVNSVCNAAMSVRTVDHYSFPAHKDQRIVVQCATRGIDSKLNPVLILADAAGRDLVVERRGGAIDFTVPADGQYVIKVHDLTFKGGSEFFYRLCLQELPVGEPVTPLPSTRSVNSFSWPPEGLSSVAAATEAEPNNSAGQVQKISLPCDLAGSFYPAADVDTFEFEAKQGEVWWVEVASERLGRPTDPTILVQLVNGTGDGETLTDVVEFSDLPSPVKVSSNGYAYDGPPYNAGTSDPLGKLEIKQDGRYRLQLSDLFGGTRNDPGNVYRLVIRRAAPDFAIVAWPLHMELRNGDRNALSKPLSLRGGATMALEVVAIRRDGFDGEIELVMEGLPAGVTAQGLKIPAGQSRGIMLLSARQDAPRGITSAKFFGRARIGDAVVVRNCPLATPAWPVRDSWSEIPSTRLMADVPVSVSGIDIAPLTITAAKNEPWVAQAGGKLTIPLMQTRRSEFSGATATMKVFGAGFERIPAITHPLTTDTSELVLDLAALKTPPGDYLIALYGGVVVKYRHHPEQVEAAEAARQKAEAEVASLAEEARKLNEELHAAPVERKAGIEQTLKDIAGKQQAAAAALTQTAEKLKQATAQAAPRDIVDIVVSEPILIRVQPAETK